MKFRGHYTYLLSCAGFGPEISIVSPEFNWYNYVGSDPVNKTDPSGLSVEWNGYYCDYAMGGIGTKTPYCISRADFTGYAAWDYDHTDRSGGGVSSGDGDAGTAPDIEVTVTASPSKQEPNPICPSNGFTDGLGKLNALPATAAGLLAGYVGGFAQELAGGPAVHVGTGNNAIQFRGLTGGEPVGFTLGNVQLYGAGTGPNGRRGRYDGRAASGTMGSHEEGHTYQFQSYSLIYMAYQFVASKLGNRRTNAMENQADDYADKGPTCP